MYVPPSRDAVPWELETDDDLPTAESTEGEASDPAAGWLPSGGPMAKPGVPIRSRARVPLATWAPFALLLGPGVVYSVLVTGWVLGVVTAGAVNDVAGQAAHWQTLTTSVAFIAGAGAAIGLRVYGRAGSWLARTPVWLVIATGSPACGVALCAAVRMFEIDGTTNTAQCFTAIAALLLLSLLCADTTVLARKPDRSHAPRARRVLLASMAGFALGTPIIADLVYVAMVDHAPSNMVQRLQAVVSSGNSFFPDFSSLRALAVTVVNSTANAITEELAFAAIVLTLARCGRSTWSIIAVAALLRAAMHLYYGPPGVGMAVFSAINAYSLLRWNRLLPLILAHAAYDVMERACSGYSWLPQGIWTNTLAVGALILAAAGLAALADKAIRRTPAPAAAGGGAC